MSFLTIASMVSMDPPGVARYIGVALMNIIYFDLLYTEEWIPYVYERLGINSNNEDEPLNKYFANNGYNGRSILYTLGSTIVFIFIWLLLWPLHLLIWLLSLLNFDL